MTPQEIENIEKEHREMLRDMQCWYGSWKELREIIDQLEDNENEAAFERFYSNSENHVSDGERQEQQHRNQLLK